MKRLTLAVVMAVLVAMTAPAWAQVTNNGGTRALSPGDTVQAGATSSSSSTSSAAAAASATQSQSQSTTIHNSNSQYQGQTQGQLQGQKQNNNQTIAPAQSTSFSEPVQDRIPGSAPAPGLTSVGTYACLGSVSLGLSGPMAGMSFGITKVDKGCEHTRDAVILMAWGYKDAALRLLSMNDDTKTALGPQVSAALAPSVPEPVTTSSLVQQPSVQAIAPSSAPSAPFCGDGKPAKLRPSGFYSCLGWDR